VRPLIKDIFNYLLQYKRWWMQRGFTTPILNSLLFSRLKQRLGGRLRLIVSGGAPLSPDTHVFIRDAFDVPVLQAYGLTEVTAGAIGGDVDDLRVDHCGAPGPRIQIKLID